MGEFCCQRRRRKQKARLCATGKFCKGWREGASERRRRSQQMLRLISPPNSSLSFNRRVKVRFEPLSVDGKEKFAEISTSGRIQLLLYCSLKFQTFYFDFQSLNVSLINFLLRRKFVMLVWRLGEKMATSIDANPRFHISTLSSCTASSASRQVPTV